VCACVRVCVCSCVCVCKREREREREVQEEEVCNNSRCNVVAVAVVMVVAAVMVVGGDKWSRTAKIKPSAEIKWGLPFGGEAPLAHLGFAPAFHSCVALVQITGQTE
jgi:hypothetical protein